MNSNKRKESRKKLHLFLFLLIFAKVITLQADGTGSKKDKNYTNSNFFPVAVWLQPSRYAKQFSEAGINIHFGMWRHLDASQLRELKNAGMAVIADRDRTSPDLWEDSAIYGWIVAHEPDNAQPFDGYWKNDLDHIRQVWATDPHISAKTDWGKWGPPIHPQTVNRDYLKLKKEDPYRPAFIILGQEVGFPEDHSFIGRSYRRGHSEDYLEYVWSADILTFDIYPWGHADEKIRDNIGLTAQGIDRLIQWSDNKKEVWGFVQATRVNPEGKKPTPDITKAIAWMQIIHGARGLVYFAHGYKDDSPQRFSENALVSDTKMMRAIKDINLQIHRLSGSINSANLDNVSEAASENLEVPIAHITKQDEKNYYIFSIAMRPKFTKATFSVNGLKAGAPIEVIDEDRTITANAGQFSDIFSPMKVHLYKFRKEDVATD